MNLIIHEKVVAESTKECVELLNQYKEGKWKRKTKFILVKGDGEYTPERTVRVFTDGEEMVSVITVKGEYRYNDKMTIICKNLDLSLHREIIKEIQKKAEKSYTHDYGEIFFNPYTMDLHIVGGDGGMFTSEKPKEEIGRMMMSGEVYDEFAEDTNFHVAGIRNVELADEYYPRIYDFDEEWDDLSIDDCFIEVGKLNDICNLEGFDYFGEDDGGGGVPNAPQPNYPPHNQPLKTVAQLEAEMNRAIAREDYEACARIRDEIKKIKGE